MTETEESPDLDIVYAPSEYFGVVFAERDIARRTAQVWHAVQDSTTWGEFRAAMPADDWKNVVYRGGDDLPSDDTPFTPDDVGWGGDGWYLGPWPPQEEVGWFPEDLIDKYGGEVDWGNPNYDQLSLPGDAADDIADELRARGHHVEKTLDGDLNYWLASAYGETCAPQSTRSTPSSSRRQLICLISTEGKTIDQIQAETKDACEKYVREARKAIKSANSLGPSEQRAGRRSE